MIRYEDDAFDSRSFLKDGRSSRVSMTMRDALTSDRRAPLVTDALGRPAGQRPGGLYLKAAADSTDHAKHVTARACADEARDEYIRDTQDAWRGRPEDPVTG